MELIEFQEIVMWVNKSVKLGEALVDAECSVCHRTWYLNCGTASQNVYGHEGTCSSAASFLRAIMRLFFTMPLLSQLLEAHLDSDLRASCVLLKTTCYEANTNDMVTKLSLIHI